MDEKLRILLCEDDENLGMLLREYLQAKGYSAELYPDGEAGYKAFLKNKYDLCVLRDDAEERWFHFGSGSACCKCRNSYHLPDCKDTEGRYSGRL